MPAGEGVRLALVAQEAVANAARVNIAPPAELSNAMKAMNTLSNALVGEHPRCRSPDVRNIVRQTTLSKDLCKALQLLQHPPSHGEESALLEQHLLAYLALHVVDRLLEQTKKSTGAAEAELKNLAVQQVPCQTRL